MTTGTTTTPARVATLLLLGAALTGCGGADASAAPQDATRADFCDAYASQVETLATLDPQKDADRAVAGLQDWAEQGRDVGTPKDMPADARRGFETIVEEISALDPDATARDLERIGEDVGRRAERDLAAFGEYAVATCPEAVERLMGEMSDRLEGEMSDQLGRLEDRVGEQLGDVDLGDLEDRLP